MALGGNIEFGVLKLSVLDQSPIPEGHTPGDALRNSLDLARFTESLGYKRYWVAEHHGSAGLACNSPEVLMGPIAAATSEIRVGSGGVMLPHYSPLKVAEAFGMLHSLYPGRIDLGIGRAAGTSQKVARMLQRDRRQDSPDDFPEQLNELLRYCGADGPAPSLLGSSRQSAIWAAELGLPYVFADFINPQGIEIAAIYREHFRPSQYLAKPYVSVALWAVCADTDDEAARLSLSIRMMMTMMFRGRLIQVPTVERAEQFVRSEGVPVEMLAAGRRFLTGSPAVIQASVEAVAFSYHADEVFLVNILHDHMARRRSYELIARQFGIGRHARAA